MKILSKDSSYTVHTRSFQKHFNPYSIRYKGQYMQVDLIDVTNPNQKNNGIKFLLTIICSLTKNYGFFLSKIKKIKSYFKRLQNFHKQHIQNPKNILMDAGTEFVLVRKLCAENNIKIYLPYSSFHGSFIERFNQSIRNLMCGWMVPKN